MSPPNATFLDLPDDIILEIATFCGDAGLALNVPVFGSVHRRLKGVIGEDFWKRWCRKKGYTIPAQTYWNCVSHKFLATLIDAKTRGQSAWETDPWSGWTQEATGVGSRIRQPSGRLLTPKDVISAEILLSWMINYHKFQESLQALFIEMLPFRLNLIEEATEQRKNIVTGIVERAERYTKRGVSQSVNGQLLSLETCSLVTSPAVTGIAIFPEVYHHVNTPELEQCCTIAVSNANGVTLSDCLHALSQWLAKSLTEAEQQILWEKHQAMMQGQKNTGNSNSSMERYEIPLNASRTTRQAVKEQFFLDHSLCLDLGRDLMNGGFYQCEAVTSKGSICIRLV